jgi:hypothetical protein
MKRTFGKLGIGSVLALVGVAALAGGVVSLAFHDDGSTQLQQSAAADRDGSRGPAMRHFRRLSPKQVLERRERFHAALAKELGVSTEKVDKAFRTLLERRLDRDVDRGRLTRKQADRMLECYDSAKCRPPFRHRLRLRGRPPGPPPMGGPGEFGPPPM